MPNPPLAVLLCPDLSALLAENTPALRAMIAALVPNPADAEDVFQEACVVLCREWENYNPASPFLPWARAICFNQVRSLRHLLRRYPQVVDPDLLGQVALPCESREESETREALDSALTQLPEPQRQLLYRFYVARETAQQIGESTGKTATSVYRAVARVRTRLRNRLKKQEKGG